MTNLYDPITTVDGGGGALRNDGVPGGLGRVGRNSFPGVEVPIRTG